MKGWGTSGYIAPEAYGAGITKNAKKCDIYSLGVIFYEMMTGKKPTPGSYKPIDGSYSSPLNGIFWVMTAKNPDSWPTINEVKNSMDEGFDFF